MTNITKNKLIDDMIIWYKWKKGYEKVVQEYKTRVYISVELFLDPFPHNYTIGEEMPDYKLPNARTDDRILIGRVGADSINIMFLSGMFPRIITSIYNSRDLIKKGLNELYKYRIVIPFVNRKYMCERISLEKERLIPYVELNGNISYIPLLECV
ncbi:MAG: hypothetical protein WD512_14910 [Candidatus Paceibacterota bacterium]